MSGGYAIVDVDEDDTNNGLQFKTFLSDDGDNAAGPSSVAGPGPSSSRARRDAPSSIFNLAYYQVYFDVDTMTVLKRVGMAMIPRGGFLTDACEGQVDLYGPFWTLVTLVLVLYTTSTLTASLQAFMAGEPSVTNIPLLSTATTLILMYGLALPALLWGATRWLGVAEWGPAEALAIYGYGMAVFIPISLFCLIPFSIVRWVLVGLGALSSGFFLVTNIYPVLASGENKMVRGLVVLVAVLHVALALAMKVLFYSYSVGGKNVGEALPANPVGDGKGAGVDVRRWF